MSYKSLKYLGICADPKTGHLFYHADFRPLILRFNLIYVRHGETYGNCGQCTANGKIDHEMVRHDKRNREQRIFQGQVDTEINQLTSLGKIQAQDAAFGLEKTLRATGLQPDVILFSPLARAVETARPFVERNNLGHCWHEEAGLLEMSFGAWENRRVCDFPKDAPCHLFYRDQHALIKEQGPDGNGTFQQAENFCELLDRAYACLVRTDQEQAGKTVLFFSHSMFGAACCILLGRGQTAYPGGHLAFDGKAKDGKSYVLPFAVPLLLNHVQKSKHAE